MRQTKTEKAKVKSIEAGTGGIQQLGNVILTKQSDTPTEAPKRPRSVGITTTETVRAPKRPRDWKGLQGGADQHKGNYL
jgi:hypothetical protein